MSHYYADASFLVSAFLGDDRAPAAWRWWTHSRAVLTVSRLTLFEAENAIRAAPFSGKATSQEAELALTGLVRARMEGLIERREIQNRRLYPAAHRLSMLYTGPGVYGAMDILHIATAQEVGSRRFVSFDLQQRRLATAAGLIVEPRF